MTYRYIHIQYTYIKKRKAHTFILTYKFIQKKNIHIILVYIRTRIYKYMYMYKYVRTHTHTHTVYDYPVNYITLTTVGNVRAHRMGATNNLQNIIMFNRNCFVSGISIILVIILFSLKVKQRKCLRYADCNYLEFINQDRKVDSNNSPEVFHQNIIRLSNKTD